MRLILAIITILVLGLSISLTHAQTGQIPPPGPSTPPAPICTVKLCDPPTPTGLAGKCVTNVIKCPEVTPPVPACVNSWGMIVPCK